MSNNFQIPDFSNQNTQPQPQYSQPDQQTDQPYAQQPYTQPTNAYGRPYYGYNYGYAQPQPPANGLAIAALVCGFVIAPLGIILGAIALSQIKKSHESGKGFAIAGIAVGTVVTLFFALIIGAVIYGISSFTRYKGDYCGTFDSDCSSTTTSYSTNTTYQLIKEAQERLKTR